MTKPIEDIRIECLRLSEPKAVSNPDMELWIARAKELEAYISGSGQSSLEAPSKPTMPGLPQARSTPVKSPAPK